MIFSGKVFAIIGAVLALQAVRSLFIPRHRSPRCRGIQVLTVLSAQRAYLEIKYCQTPTNRCEKYLLSQGACYNVPGGSSYYVNTFTLSDPSYECVLYECVNFPITIERPTT
jgi:hypothetical protein